ncbi:MAG: trigger factor [Candidatus Paceibacterota bacterium]
MSINIKVKKLPKSEVEIEGALEAETFETYFSKALKKIGENMEIPGFRKGKIPENILLSNVPEIKVLEQMAEMAISEHYPKILESEKIDAISRPEITITKLARNNPLEFKIKTAVMPEIQLPDYKEISKKITSKITDTEKNITVTDEDLEKTIQDIRKSRAPKKHMAEHTCEGEDCKHENKEEVKEVELPEFNDEYVQALGPFKNVEDFKVKLRENIKLEKENQAKEKTRLKIVEKIIDDSKMDLPDILIEVELDKILYRMESDIAQMGLKFEDYLKHLNKTVEDIRKEFKNDAEKKAKLALVLHKISEIEKIVADQEQVAKEVELILNHYKEADPERARLHAENVLTNEKIFQLLETQ